MLNLKKKSMILMLWKWMLKSKVKKLILNVKENDGLRYGIILKDFQLVLMGGKGLNYFKRLPAAATRDTSKAVHENKDTVLTKSMRDMLKEFKAYESTEFVLSQKSQLEMYLDEPRSDIELVSMARDILSIPVSTVASESAFSNGGRVLDQYRSSLNHDIVEALICSKDWLFGIKGDEELCLQELTDDIMEEENKK
ncbi:hypothetical protein LXL04_005497 [Taraxacum kok-saghyz]